VSAESVDEVIVALDLSATAITAGLVTMRGEVIDRDETPIDHHLQGEALFSVVVRLVDGQMERARDHHMARCVAMGIGCAGPVAPDLEAVSPSDIPAWREFPLRGRLAATTSLPVFGDLDAKALALAEGWLGAAQGKDCFMAMVVGSSITGGIVLNGQLLDGAGGAAGHVGHVIVEPNGHRCPCGSRGCLEAEASSTAIAALTGRTVAEPTYDTMQRAGRMVGRAAASVCNLLDLDLVVVGGPVAVGFGATFFNSAQEALDEHATLRNSRGARITPVRLGDRGPLVGAAAIGVRGVVRRRRAARFR